MRPVVLLAVLLSPAARAAAPAPFTGPWDVPALQAAAVKPEWGNPSGAAREVYYPGEPFRGKPTRVFAYYAKPAGDGPFPAVVLVHGGGGKAFREWAEHWAGRGYCALAMDLAGKGPAGPLPDGGPDQTDESKFREFDDTSAKDMWTYHAVAAVVRGHNLVRSFPEVDRDRTAVTGISWGGYLTCIVAGLDDRFKAAVPLYGCGFLHENSVWKPKLDGFPAARRDRWVATFDPSKYLPNVRCPMLFTNGTNDFAYPLDSYQKCYNRVPAPPTLSVQVRMRHGHIWTFREVDTFIDSHLKKGDPLADVGPAVRTGDSVSAPVTAKVPPKAGFLHYAVAEGAWQKREWKTLPAELAGGRVTAKLPAARPLVYYLAVTDARGLETSSPHAELPGPDTWVGQKALARRPGLSLRAEPGGADRPVSQIVFTVLEDAGDRIRVHYPGLEGWATKADWVRLADAADHFAARVKADPADAFAHSRLGVAHRYAGRPDLAVKDLDAAVKLDPKSADFVGIRGMMHWAVKDYDAAIGDYTAAVKLDPKYALGLRNRGLAWAAKGDFEKAIADYTAAGAANPKYPPAPHDRATAWRARKEYAKAAADLAAAVAIDPRYTAARLDLARLLAGCPDAAVRDGERAVAEATAACDQTNWTDGAALDALAAAWAECGDFGRAAAYQTRALRDEAFVKQSGAEAVARLALYQKKTPWRE